MTITQTDREAAESILWVQTLIDDKQAIIETFAAHREAAFEAGREQAEREVVKWRDFHKDPPQPGMKVVIVCDDGCSTGLALITDEGVLDGEDGMPLGVTFLQGAIWMALPDNFPIAFMEAHDDY